MSDHDTAPSAGVIEHKDACERCGSTDDVHLSRGRWHCGPCRAGKAHKKKDKTNAHG